MKTAIILAAAAASASAADCQMTDFLPLAGYLNDKSVFGLCAKDIGISFMDFTNPSWIPTDLAMTKKFAASASCKEFFALVTAQMLKITPPCTLKQGPTTTTSDVAGKLTFDQAIAAWTALYSPTTAPGPNPTSAPGPNPTTAPGTTSAPGPNPTSVSPNTTTSAPGPNPVPVGCTDVSVVGDATYCIAGPICSGSGLLPAGTKCPKAGDVASKDCHKHLKSYTNGKCIAPADTVCQKIPSGAYGCVVGTAPAPTPAPSKP
uniref:Secreted protein n=1 Tax=Achlya hypogyna TaxID=1202772 RepID=A0A0A7CNW1_ACHHY|nr:secreted protein [Achlya hypogyna]